MKELYISPALNVLCFAPAERVASDVDLDWDGIGNGGISDGTTDDGSSGGSGDGIVDIPIGKK